MQSAAIHGVGRRKVGHQFVLADVDQRQLQRSAGFKASDEKVEPAPRRFQRARRRRVQDGAQFTADRRVDRSDQLILPRVRRRHDIGRNDFLDQTVGQLGPRCGRLRRLFGRRGQRGGKQIVRREPRCRARVSRVVAARPRLFRWRRAGTDGIGNLGGRSGERIGIQQPAAQPAQPIEQVDPLHKRIRAEVIEFAIVDGQRTTGKHQPELWRNPCHDVVEVVAIDGPDPAPRDAGRITAAAACAAAEITDDGDAKRRCRVDLPRGDGGHAHRHAAKRQIRHGRGPPFR